jgi:hypothetical protein
MNVIAYFAAALMSKDFLNGKTHFKLSLIVEGAMEKFIVNNVTKVNIQQSSCSD